MNNKNNGSIALELINEQEVENLKDCFCTILAFIILKKNNMLPKVFQQEPLSITEPLQASDTQESEYLTRKQVVELYHPLFTDYGLSQAIHKGEVPYIKRGRKYFFSRSDIDKWISDCGQADTKKRVQYV